MQTCELELRSNSSSSTEEENTNETNLRRSKRLPKRNHIIRLELGWNYRKDRQRTERSGVSHEPKRQPGIRHQPELLTNQSDEWTVQGTQTNRTLNNELTQTTANGTKELWTDHRFKEDLTSPIGQLSSVCGGGVKYELYLEDKL